MRNHAFFVVLIMLFIGCSNEPEPDVRTTELWGQPLQTGEDGQPCVDYSLPGEVIAEYPYVDLSVEPIEDNFQIFLSDEYYVFVDSRRQDIIEDLLNNGFVEVMDAPPMCPVDDPDAGT